VFREAPEGFVLEGRDEDGVEASAALAIPKQAAEKPEEAVFTMKKQLSKLSGTMFSLASLELRAGPFFIRTSELNRLRRDLVSAMEERRLQAYQRPLRMPASDPSARCPVTKMDYRFNVSNLKAREFYRKHGVTRIEPAFELQKPGTGAVVMTSSHCLRRCLGSCPRMKPHKRLAEPLFIESGGHRFRLDFDCTACRMLVLTDDGACGK
ncbi:MAG TPA: DUF3656 domain-containing protein, partial [Syntrophales bacterium]|nr:DUF3656 domain-containing protein [Syntrophales bacterium]